MGSVSSVYQTPEVPLATGRSPADRVSSGRRETASDAMPETGRDAKGFQDSAVQSAAAPHEPAGGTEDGQEETAGAKAGSPPADGDEPDRVAIVELETQLEAMPPAQKPASPYPDFPETNPFRLAAGDAPVTPAPAVRPREHRDSSLAHRRRSQSDLTLVIPPAGATG